MLIKAKQRLILDTKIAHNVKQKEAKLFLSFVKVCITMSKQYNNIICICDLFINKITTLSTLQLL